MNTRIARQIPLDYAAYAEPVDRSAQRRRARRLRNYLKYLPHALLTAMLFGLLVTAAVTGPAPHATQPISHMAMHQ